MMKLAYTRSGSPDAPAIVFLHGNAMAQWMWAEQTRHFSDYDCYNVDLPGHGGSSQIAWESFDQAADCVARIIAEDIPDKAVHIVGMSLGAVVGLNVIARHPQKIERAVLTGAFADAPPRWLMTIQGFILSAVLGTGFGKRMFARMLQLPPEDMPAYTESINALSMPSFRRIIQQITHFKPLEGLEAIRVPLLFVTGEKDVSLNRESVIRLAHRVPGAVGMYAPGVHHGWNGENPDLFNQMTRAWIEGYGLPQQLITAA